MQNIYGLLACEVLAGNIVKFASFFFTAVIVIRSKKKYSKHLCSCFTIMHVTQLIDKMSFQKIGFFSNSLYVAHLYEKYEKKT